MSWSQAATSFVSLFAAALLAFYLDSLRERRATRRWVDEYLAFWLDLLGTSEAERTHVTSLFDADLRALDALSDGGERRPEDAWESLQTITIESPVALTPPLLGEGAAVVPVGLLRQMFEVDAYVAGFRSQTQSMHALFDSQVRPLTLRRPWPLNDEETRALALYRRELSGLRSVLDEIYDRLTRLAKDLQAAGFGPRN